MPVPGQDRFSRAPDFIVFLPERSDGWGWEGYETRFGGNTEIPTIGIGTIV